MIMIITISFFFRPDLTYFLVVNFNKHLEVPDGILVTWEN